MEIYLKKSGSAFSDWWDHVWEFLATGKPGRQGHMMIPGWQSWWMRSIISCRLLMNKTPDIQRFCDPHGGEIIVKSRESTLSRRGSTQLATWRFWTELSSHCSFLDVRDLNLQILAQDSILNPRGYPRMYEDIKMQDIVPNWTKVWHAVAQFSWLTRGGYGSLYMMSC